MPSKTVPEAQIIVRCTAHVPKRAVAEPYVVYAPPVGDGRALVCGRPGCEGPGVIMMTTAAHAAWRDGIRVFYPRTMTVRILVGEAIFTLE